MFVLWTRSMVSWSTNKLDYPADQGFGFYGYMMPFPGIVG